LKIGYIILCVVDQKFLQKLEAKQPEGEISVYCNENENFLISKNEHCTQVYCQKSKQNKTHTNNIENKNIRKNRNAYCKYKFVWHPK